MKQDPFTTSLCGKGISFEATGDVWTFGLVTATYASYGTMEAKVRTAPVGGMMSRVAKWLLEERSYGMSGVGILLNAALFLVVGWILFYWTIHVEHQKFWMDGKHYEMVALGAISDKGKVLYAPIYREIK